MRNYFMTLANLNRNVRLLLLGWGTVLFSFFGLISVLQNLYLLRLGFGLEFIGVLAAVGQFSWALCALPAGEFGRRFGTRRALLCGFTLNAVSYTLFMLVEWLPKEWWPAWLIICWVLVWSGAAFNAVNVSPHWMAITSESERHFAFAAQPGVSAAGAFLGSLTGGVLAAWLTGMLGPGDAAGPYRYGLYLAVVVNWLGILPLLWTQPGQTAKAERQAAGDGRIPWALFALFGLATFLVSIGDGSVRAFFNVYLDQDLSVSTDQIGLALGVAQLFSFAVTLAAPVITQRMGAGPSWAASTVCLALSVALTALPGQWTATAGYVGIVAISGFGGIGRAVFSQEIVTAGWRPTMSAVSIIGLSVGWGVVAMAGGYLIGQIGYGGFFLAAAVVCVLATPLIWRLAARHTPQEVAATTT